MEGFGFATSEIDSQIDNIFLNELPLLHLFRKYFKKEARKEILDLEREPLHLPAMIGSNVFETNPYPHRIMPKEKLLFLQRIGIDINNSLSSREREVLQLLLKGYSANGIATQIHLSKRTVEHHIDRIKEKLVCFSKTELVQKAQELQNYGLLIF